MRGIAIGIWLVGTVVGCVADARVDLAAAHTLGRLAAQMELTLAEYHAETESGDDLREAHAITAFVARVQRESDDQDAVDRSVAQFNQALARLRADRRTEWMRYMAAMDNVALIREVTAGLQELAIQSMSLEDDARRYVTGLLEAARQVDAESNVSLQNGLDTRG